MNTWENEETPAPPEEIDRSVSTGSIVTTAIYMVVTLAMTVYVGTGLYTGREVAGFVLGITAVLALTADLIALEIRRRRAEFLRPVPRHRERDRW
jgi:hypothetical protein